MRRLRTNQADTRPTLEDVAREAGVSVATVSRTLNSPDLVRAKTKEQVTNAVAATGYTPHFGGRALALNRTNTVGAVIPTLNNAIFAHGINAFEEALRERGYTLLLGLSNYDPDTERTNVLRMIERGVDALMLVGTEHDSDTVHRLRRSQKPFVCAWSFAPQSGLPTVGFDNHGAMSKVVDHLVDLGHRDIAMIAGITKNNDRARERVNGVLDAVAERGLQIRPHWLVEVRYSVNEASACATHLFSEPERPSAVICGNDVIAYGTLFAAAGCNVLVPEDVSIVGFDDLALSARVPPGLTTIRVPAIRMGEAAANRLADIIEDGVGADADGSIELPTELVVRGTTGQAAR